MKFVSRFVLSFVVATLVSSQTTYSGTETATVAGTKAVTSASNTTTRDAPYKALAQALSCDGRAMQKVACANRNNQNPGFFLQLITSVDVTDYTILLNLGNGTIIGEGAACLATIKQITADIVTILQHTNDSLGCPANITCTATDGLSGSGLTGEAYNQCVLQQLGKDILLFVAAGASATGTVGPYQQLMINMNKDLSALNQVVATNDSSDNCEKLGNAFGSEMQQIFAAGGGGYICPSGWGTTSTVRSVTTTATGGNGYGYGR